MNPEEQAAFEKSVRLQLSSFSYEELARFFNMLTVKYEITKRIAEELLGNGVRD